MVSLLGLNFPVYRPLYFCLSSVTGIGPTYAAFICRQAGVSPLVPIGTVSRSILRDIHRSVTSSRLIGPVFRRFILDNIRRKTEIKTYQGKRHLEGLPVRGQNSKTNARTARRVRNKKLIS